MNSRNIKISNHNKSNLIIKNNSNNNKNNN